jgi:hypothetical protein
MKKLLLLACCIPCMSFAQDAPSGQDTAARKQIEQVIETFRTSIINKDKASLNTLPLNNNITFSGALGDETIAAIHAKRPDLTSSNVMPMTYPGFVDYVTASSKHEEETFSNIGIQTDGTVASVYFDYTYNVDGKKTNWGHETWGLVKSSGNWKISSIVWSITFKPDDQWFAARKAPATQPQKAAAGH